MSLDPLLVDSIKAHFVRKSSAQLQEIVQSTDQACWSAEAVVAASEVLEDRRAGRAEEPEVAEEDSPPPYHYNPDYIALGFLGCLLAGLPTKLYQRRPGAPRLLLPSLGIVSLAAEFLDPEIESAPDLPIPFGPNMAWLALDSTDTEAVAATLGLRETRSATWAEGIEGARQLSVFVTPPLADWTLVVGRVLFPPDRPDAFVTPLLESLSEQFGDAQYFCTAHDVGLHVWARAWRGRLARGYGWLGDKNLTLWNEGAPTKEERDLGFHFVDRRWAATASGKVESGEAPPCPDENCVTQLAFLWSIDPTILNEQFMEPANGLLGSVHGVDPGRAP